MDTNVVLVFDGDDTLWMNEWQYSKARAEFLSFLYTEFGDLMPSIALLMPRYFAIDHDLFSIWGIERGRVSRAMQIAYHELLEYFKAKTSPDRMAEILEKQEEHEKLIFKLGDQPFDFYDMRWVEGAEEMLAELKEDGRFTLRLLTSYDAKVWRERSKYLGVDRFFDGIKTVSGRKTKHDFVDVSDYWRTLHRSRFCAIGNGESDIHPALEISPLWYGIYIPHASSSPVFNNKQGADAYIPPPIDDKRVLNLCSIRDILSVDFDDFCLKGVKLS